ncbi:MAG: hypothetical protein VB050_09030 [Geobacteraceae bacterium]|nr:hypothetical protein [Geobacteraceae bacterium]
MIKDPTHISDYPFWWRFADPAPDFLKHLKEEEIRVIIAHQIESQVTAVKRQQEFLKAQVEDLAAMEQRLVQIKTMIEKRK